MIALALDAGPYALGSGSLAIVGAVCRAVWLDDKGGAHRPRRIRPHRNRIKIRY